MNPLFKHFSLDSKGLCVAWHDPRIDGLNGLRPTLRVGALHLNPRPRSAFLLLRPLFVVRFAALRFRPKKNVAHHIFQLESELQNIPEAAPVVDQSSLVSGQVRPQFSQTHANLFDERRPDGNAVGRDHQSRNTRCSQIGPDLCLTHSKDAFFVAMVDFNLPTIEVGLQKFFGRQLVVVAQQVGLLPVIELSLFGLAIGGGREDQEPQKPSATSALPEQLADFLEANPAVSRTMKDFGLFAGDGGDGGVMINLFWTEELCPITKNVWFTPVRESPSF